jgi:hypothetical protein
MMQPTPLRPDDQVAGGFIAMRLGGQSFEVKVLPMALSRKWLVDAKAAIVTLKGTAEGLDSFEDIADFIAGQSTAMMDLLIAYDALGDKVLPEREWIDTTATDTECYDSWKRVTAATSPLAQEALRIVPDLMPVLIDAFRKAVTRGTAIGLIAMSSSKSTSGSPPSTDGAPVSSPPTSPTSSSRSTPRKARRVASTKPSPSSTAS